MDHDAIDPPDNFIPAAAMGPAEVLESAASCFRQGDIKTCLFMIRFALARLGKRATAAAPEELGGGILDTLNPQYRGYLLDSYEKHRYAGMCDGLVGMEAGSYAALKVAEDNNFFRLHVVDYERAIFNRDWWMGYLLGIVAKDGLSKLAFRSGDPPEVVLEDIITAAAEAAPVKFDPGCN